MTQHKTFMSQITAAKKDAAELRAVMGDSARVATLSFPSSPATRRDLLALAVKCMNEVPDEGEGPRVIMGPKVLARFAAALTQPTTVQQAGVGSQRQQIADLVLGEDLVVSSPLESTQGFGGDIEHRFQISNGTERYGVVIIVTALKGMQPGERGAS